MGSEEHRRSVEALVLRSRKVNEGDRLLDLLGTDGVMLRAKAKWAARSRKRFGGGLEVLSMGRFSLGRRRSQWGWMVEQVQVGESFQALRGDLGAFYLASYFCELLLRSVQRDERLEGAFEVTSFALHWLERGQVDLNRVKAFFELRLLTLLGLLAPFEGCARCGTDESPTWTFRPGEGSWRCAIHGEGEGGVVMRPGDRRALEDLAFGELERVLRGRWSREQRRKGNRLGEEMLRIHVASDLRSLAFVKPFLEAPPSGE